MDIFSCSCVTITQSYSLYHTTQLSIYIHLSLSSSGTQTLFVAININVTEDVKLCCLSPLYFVIIQEHWEAGCQCLGVHAAVVCLRYNRGQPV